MCVCVCVRMRFGHSCVDVNKFDVTHTSKSGLCSMVTMTAVLFFL